MQRVFGVRLGEDFSRGLGGSALDELKFPRMISHDEAISIDGVPGEYYRCTNSPMVITRKLFEEIGGYCELYSGWGYEDSHFEHKLEGKIIEFKSNADHLLNIHNLVSSSTGWGRGKDTNRQLFFDLQNKSLVDRISDDRMAYFGAKAAYYETKQSQG
jgi:hypothetical protein